MNSGAASASNPFVKEVRELGEVTREHVSARAWKPGAGEGGGEAEEFARVRIDFTDVDTSAAVDESKGVLATSFDRSASHFLKGMAVLVEGVGYGLPYLIVGLLVGLPLYGAVRLSRKIHARRDVVIQQV